MGWSARADSPSMGSVCGWLSAAAGEAKTQGGVEDPEEGTELRVGSRGCGDEGAEPGADTPGLSV